MVKRPLSLLLAAAFSCGVAACHKTTPAMSAAQRQKDFQDKQRLVLIKVYEDLGKKYPNMPDADKAAKAQERLRVLRQQAGVQTPAPAKQ